MSNSAQWSNLLLHLGAWQGSFTRLSSQGEVQSDTPSIVTLEGRQENQVIRQTLQYFHPQTGELAEEKVLEYSSLNRSVLFFDNGAFSQGSMQFGPFAEFGSEFGFLHGERRLRLVPMFGADSNLATITLIREQLQGSSSQERPALTLEMLLGEWQGEAVTLYADWRSPETYPTTLSLNLEGDRLHQTLTAPNFQMHSTATVTGSQLLFDQGKYPVQVLLLPDGASCNVPPIVPRHQPFVLEAGWLIAPNLRWRLIRRYDDRGGWNSLTLVIEKKVK